MILVDSDIKRLVKDKMLILEGYNENNVNSISYDLTINKIITYDKDGAKKEVDEFILEPNQYVYIKTKELLRIPKNILGRVAERNSIMRLGLVVNGPHYQPGHTTYSFLRVQNISKSEYNLRKNDKIAQIIFEQLTNIPDIPYDKDDRSSFNNEYEYMGLSKYESEYNRAINRIDTINKSLEDRESRIYSNIITFMGIFISIFSILTINFELFSQQNLGIEQLTKNMLIINLSLGLVITFLVGLIIFIINKHVKKKFLIAFITILALLAVINSFVIFLDKNNSRINSGVADIILEDSELAIAKVQELLSDKGFNIEITGIMDLETYEVLNEYKKKNNINSNSLLDIIIDLNNSK